MSFAIAPRQRCKPGASHGDFRDYGPQPLGTVARSRRHGRGQTGWARIPAAPRGGPALAPGAQPWAKQRRYPIPQSAADTPRLEPWIARCFTGSPGLRRPSGPVKRSAGYPG